MKIRSILASAIVVGAVAGLLSALALLLCGSLWWTVAAWGVGIGLAIFLLSLVFMERYTFHRIKPIYQRMFSKEVKAKELELSLGQGDEQVKDLEGEIHSWAEVSRREIARLKENEKYRKEYVGNVAHEIKTPIFNVQGYVQTLLDGGLEDPSINRLFLERADKSIERLINIVTDLDQITKLESGVLQLSMESFDVVELARDVVESLEIDAQQKGVRVSISGSGNFQAPPIYVTADKHYISQVFVNLISNSLKYGRERGGRTKVSFIDLFDKVMIEVSDNGCGIAKEDIPRVFERFYRTDKSRSREQGGTGLGLSIVKHILEAHRESIMLRSDEGKGSTFSFTLVKSDVL